jgi:phosphatidylglycerophosphatase A
VKLIKSISYIIATGLGCGYIPKIPGTVGSLFAVIFYWYYPVESHLLIMISFLLFIAGLPAATLVERFEGKDSGKIVIDEITGQILTFVFIPFSGINLIFGFVLFRIFDIIKPFPINISQKLPNGWGIMIDDVLAAIYANITLRLILLIFN